jgi:hypothetical protein
VRKQQATRIIIGEVAGHHFYGQADLKVVFWCRKGSTDGFYHVRKRLVNRAAFNYDPRLGWEVDRWFEWP